MPVSIICSQRANARRTQPGPAACLPLPLIWKVSDSEGWWLGAFRVPCSPSCTVPCAAGACPCPAACGLSQKALQAGTSVRDRI